MCCTKTPSVCACLCMSQCVSVCVCMCKGGRGRGRDVYSKCVKISDHSQESGCNSWDGLKIVYKIIPNIFFKFTEALPFVVNTVLTISQISITQEKGNKLLLLCRIYKKKKKKNSQELKVEMQRRHSSTTVVPTAFLNHSLCFQSPILQIIRADTLFSFLA